MLNWLMAKGLAGDDLQTAYGILDRLHQVIHKEPVIFYYEEESQYIDRVLKIFIRLNSQGTALSQSDLLHSIAVAQWSERDARAEISKLVDDLNRTGPWHGIFTQNFVLKAGLMLANVTSVGFKVQNFTRKNMSLLEKDWDQIRQALILTATLAKNYGLSAQNIRAVSSLLPIAYYLFITAANENLLTHTKHAQDRQAIRHWLLASLLKPSGIWGSGLDTLLTALREIIREKSEDGFPADALQLLMEERGKSLAFSDAEVERLADLTYGDKATFLLLSLLYPFVDLRNKFHVDHVFPSSLLKQTALRKEGMAEDKISRILLRRNLLTNLQLMDGAENNEKRAKPPNEWLRIRYTDAAARQHYLDRYDMGQQLPSAADEFDAFYEARRTRLIARIKSVLND